MADDYYKILGVSVAATAAVIRSAYRRLAVTLHPDRAGQQSTAAFQRLVAAYEVLSDPHKRARYDARRAPATTTSAGTRSAPATREFIRRTSGPLRSLIAIGVVRRAPDGTFELVLTREEAAQGGFVMISTPAPNQLTHSLSIPAGVADGSPISSVIKIDGQVSELRFVLRIS